MVRPSVKKRTRKYKTISHTIIVQLYALHHGYAILWLLLKDDQNITYQAVFYVLDNSPLVQPKVTGCVGACASINVPAASLPGMRGFLGDDAPQR